MSSTSRPSLLQLRVSGPIDPWIELGFAPTTAGHLRVGTTALIFDEPDAPAAISAWHLTGVEHDIDGLATARLVDAGPASIHPNTASSLDHVVVRTPDVERTQLALADAGLDLRRVREAGSANHPITQSFYRLGEVILEVVGPPSPTGDDPASLWGLVANVDDLDRMVERCADHISIPKAAVQRGRRISTVRPSVGLAIPVAFMDDHADR